ncbi:PIG-L deacetylase family protein [Candidatus Viridilinea mediisalina]|uniref:GlcNAc-PI de-N-acetylase n=1 Tax=Candidatus Viridilinea mediisalina TaxID=2024553 RepID=A0A2A6RLI3_9CHLR|nr:PIG-L deacetylase family protein [Candidatus Viridilinea mediisalina]PDW03785.1 GlcNAc-PI de-N-acetylase [Candidatus Viridilinea mediisalina]
MQHETTDSMTILVIAAHPDDIEFGVAGSVARWMREGHHVVYCVITDGAAGTNAPDADLEALATTRRAEQSAAAATLGVSDVRFLGYRDGVLQPALELRRELTRLIRSVRPQRVVCQDPTTVFVGGSYINHPDHRAAGEAAIYAVFPSAETRPIFPELLDEGLEPHHVQELYMTLTLHPDTYVDITAFMERKVKALLCHQSQVTEKDAEWIRQWDAEYGIKAGTPFAEAFRVLRF